MVGRGGTVGFGGIGPRGSTARPAVGEGARTALRELAPALRGADVTDRAEVHRRRDHVLRGHEYAKSALDVACWDAYCRHVGQPVGALLRGVLQRILPLSVSFPLGPPPELAPFARPDRGPVTRRVAHMPRPSPRTPRASAQREARRMLSRSIRSVEPKATATSAVAQILA
mgnify:CR=1 FL=1